MKNTTAAPKRIKSFTDLTTWKQAHVLVVDVYKISKDFPGEEKFGLTSQIRRSAISITSNIAEGFARLGQKDKIHFYNIAIASLAELQNQLLVSRDVGYINAEELNPIADQSVRVRKLILGLIKSSESKK